jgi:MFS family permease
VSTGRVLGSLRRRNFRLFLVGQLVSNSGTWMQNVALAWLVLQVSHSPLDVGLVSALQFVPSLLFGVYGGLVADRFPKRKVLVFTQGGMASAAAVLAILDFVNLTPLWVVYLVTFASGTFQAIDTPVRQAFLSEMVGLDDLPNAVGLNSATFNTTRITGPALGAIAIRVAGVGACFGLNAVSYLAVITALLAMKTSELYPSQPVRKGSGQIREGLLYVWRTPRLRQTLGLLAVVGTLAFNFNTVFPVLAKSGFHGNASTYAAMLVALGVGSVIGALVAASRPRPRQGVVVLAALAMGILELLAATQHNLDMEIAILGLVGVASMLYLSTSNSTCQLASVPEMRGRVMAVYSVVFLGSTPIGSTLIGFIDQEFNARWGLVGGGLPTVVAALVLGGLLLHRLGPGRHGRPGGARVPAAATVVLAGGADGQAQ